MALRLFAISELFIVAAVIISMAHILKRPYWLMSVAYSVLGSIAMIGAIRYGLNLIDSLAVIHQNASQIGGAIAVVLMGGQFIKSSPIAAIPNWCLLLAMTVSLILIIYLPPMSQSLLFSWMLVPIIITFLSIKDTVFDRLILSGVSSLFLLNFIFIRQSDFLGRIISWHLYHTLIALWLIAMVLVLKRIEGK